MIYKISEYSLGNEDKALAFPDKLRESLASQSCDPQQIVSLFKEKQLLVEASWEQPDPQTMKWIRFLSREANLAKRSDVVQYLRSISPEGTVGEQSMVCLCNTREFKKRQRPKAVILLVKRAKNDGAARIFVHFSPVLVKTTRLTSNRLIFIELSH